MNEIRSYRRVFDLERRIYSIERLRLNPAGVPVRGVVYLLTAVAGGLLAGRLPLLGPSLRTLPWFMRDLGLPAALAAALTVIRIDGRTVGIVANQPTTIAGTLDIPSSQKAARFVSFCDAFNIALVTLVDTPGFYPGKDLEWRGMIRHGAQLAFAYCRATVPRVNLTLRKSYGGAYIAMNSRSLGATRVFAWPDAEIAVMGAVAAVRILHRRTLASVPPEQLHEAETRLAAEHEATAGGLQRAVDLGVIDAIIEPSQTRRELARAIAEAPQLKGNHANIPL